MSTHQLKSVLQLHVGGCLITDLKATTVLVAACHASLLITQNMWKQ